MWAAQCPCDHIGHTGQHCCRLWCFGAAFTHLTGKFRPANGPSDPQNPNWGLTPDRTVYVSLALFILLVSADVEHCSAAEFSVSRSRVIIWQAVTELLWPIISRCALHPTACTLQRDRPHKAHFSTLRETSSRADPIFLPTTHSRVMFLRGTLPQFHDQVLMTC